MKAAYIIKINTIHYGLAVPASLSLKNYKIILLDEISMVENNMFTVQLNNRLKDLKGSKEDFGGVSVITLGPFSTYRLFVGGFICKI